MNYKEKFFVGQKFEQKIEVKEKYVHDFAKVSGDRNPIHIDRDYASTTLFKRPIVHGMLVASFFSKILGNDLPGRGAIYLSQTMSFLKPIFIGDLITLQIEIISIREDKPIIKLKTICITSDSNIAIEGEAILKVPEND